jgi:prophage regulatory protein
MHERSERLLRLPEVKSRTGYKRASIYKKMRLGEFPCPYSLGGRAVAWKLSDIENWIESRTKTGTTVQP